jgi:hypothetical protein
MEYDYDKLRAKLEALYEAQRVLPPDMFNALAKNNAALGAINSANAVKSDHWATAIRSREDSMFDPRTGEIRPEMMLAIRMTKGKPTPAGIELNHYGNVAVKYVTCEPHAVYLFCIVSGKALVIEDDPELFPSDTLIGKLRMMEK